MMSNIVEQKARSYDRQRDLPSLLSKFPFFTSPASLRDDTPQNTKKIMSLLEELLEDERRAGRRQAWTYCPQRHMKLMVALQGEKNILSKSKENAHAI